MSKKKLFNISLESEENGSDVDLNKSVVSNEELVGTLAITGVLLAVGFGIDPLFNWLEKRKNKKPKESDLEKKVKQSLENLTKTVLNDNWLSKQTFKTGKVKVNNSHLLLIGGKLPTDPLRAIDDSLRTILSLDNKISPEYDRFSKTVLNVTKPIKDIWESLSESKFNALSDKDIKDLIELQEDIDRKLDELEHPVSVYWKIIPDHRTIVGQLIKNYNRDRSIGEESIRSAGECYQIDKLNNSEDIQLPLLDKTNVKKAGELLKRLYELEIKHGNFSYTLFQKTVDSIYKIPSPQDGWPHKEISGLDIDDVFPDLASGTFGDIGALGEQANDPIFKISDSYSEILSDLQKLLINWINASVKNSGVSNEGFKEWVKRIFSNKGKAQERSKDVNDLHGITNKSNKLDNSQVTKNSVMVSATTAKNISSFGDQKLSSDIIVKNAEKAFTMYKSDLNKVKSQLAPFTKTLTRFTEDIDELDDDTEFNELKRVIERHLKSNVVDFKLVQKLTESWGTNPPIGLITSSYKKEMSSDYNSIAIQYNNNVKETEIKINIDDLNKIIKLIFELNDFTESIEDYFYDELPTGIDLTDPPFRAFMDDIDGLDDLIRNRLYNLNIDVVNENNYYIFRVISDRVKVLTNSLINLVFKSIEK